MPRDDRFANRAARAKFRHELLPKIIALVDRRSTAEWIETLDAAGIPCGTVNNVKKAVKSPQSVEYRSLRRTHYKAVPVDVLATPVGFGGVVDHPVQPPAHLGEHTRCVLRELLGMDDDAIERLGVTPT